jgi:hypothetical protein
MTRYRAPVTERVEAAKYIAAKVSGVNQIQQRHDLPSSDAFIAANPDKFSRLPSPGDCFIADQLLAVPYG